jgi:hypothetical protein
MNKHQIVLLSNYHNYLNELINKQVTKSRHIFGCVTKAVFSIWFKVTLPPVFKKAEP